MKKLRKILAAYDRSEYSPFIIERAGQLSDALSAGLTIVINPVKKYLTYYH